MLEGARGCSSERRELPAQLVFRMCSPHEAEMTFRVTVARWWLSLQIVEAAG